jgi:hypothetical protein
MIRRQTRIPELSSFAAGEAHRTSGTDIPQNDWVAPGVSLS